MASNRDRYWMKRALVLARRGAGFTAPNPMVGAIVLDRMGKLCGEGFHAKPGGPHAEVVALERAGKQARGGTLYVTLEPCTVHGKTPPCVDRVLKSFVKRVVASVLDPNPKVNGAGIATLRKAGISAELGCLSDIGEALNRPFFYSIRARRPFVTAKVAISLDAKIGTEGKRVLLSGPVSALRTMRLRAGAGAILVGSETIKTDDPSLTVRGRYTDRNPIRAVVDRDLSVKPSARLFHSKGGPVWVFTREAGDAEFETRCRYLKNAGAELFHFHLNEQNALPLKEILASLAKSDVQSVLLEGGSRLFHHFARADLIDRWIVYLTRQVLGAQFEGRSTVSLPKMGPFSLKIQSVIRRGADWEIRTAR